MDEYLEAVRAVEKRLEFADTQAERAAADRVLTDTLKRLLDTPDLGSKAWIWTQYDHTVRTNTVIGLATGTITGGDGGQGAAGWHAEHGHGFAQQVFAQDRPERCTAIAVAGIGRYARAF